MTGMMDHTSRPHPGHTMMFTISTNSCKTVSDNLTQRPSRDRETPEHKTLNNAIVPTNKVINTTWKLR